MATSNGKNNVNPGQINVRAHTNGLCISVPITQYIVSGSQQKIAKSYIKARKNQSKEIKQVIEPGSGKTELLKLPYQEWHRIIMKESIFQEDMTILNTYVRHKGAFRMILEWPISRRPTASNADKDVEKQKCSFIADGNANGTATLKDSLGISYKTKHTLTMWPSKYLSKEVENSRQYKNQHTNIYKSLIYYC